MIHGNLQPQIARHVFFHFMRKGKILLFTLALFAFGLKAQQPLWHISLLAEETLNEVGQENIQMAWFVTGKDTVYTIHLRDSKIVGRATPYDFDTIWTDGDSLYQRHIDYLRDTEERAAYTSNKSSVTSSYENGKRVRRIELRLDENGEMYFHWDWTPRQQVISKIEKGKEYMRVFNPSEPWWISYYNSEHDTIRMWDVQHGDTVGHWFRWNNFSDRSSINFKRHLTRTRTHGDTTSLVTHFPERTDSNYSIDTKDKTIEILYTKPQGERYRVANKHYSWQGAEEKYEYQYLASSDTARHNISILNPDGYTSQTGALRLIKQIYYDKDSALYKSVSFIYNEAGELSQLKVKKLNNVEYTIATKPWPDEPEMFYEGSPMVVEEPYTTLLKVPEMLEDKVTVNSKTLRDFILNQVTLYEFETNFRKWDEWWPETIIIEIGADKTISGVSRSPNSELWVDGFLLKTKGKTVATPKKLKTVLYYIDANGKKRKQKLEYILLPVKVEARNQLEY